MRMRFLVAEEVGLCQHARARRPKGCKAIRRDRPSNSASTYSSSQAAAAETTAAAAWLMCALAWI